jgi:uncharacterized integral membrane protein (TIGR00697 family)
MDRPVKLYVFLCTLFSVIVVVGNLIFQKYVHISVFNYTAELSVGIFLYPLTFLLSDLVTEFYGKSSAHFMAVVSICVSFIATLLLCVSDALPALSWSPVNDAVFHQVFGVFWVALFASLIAMYSAQTVDIIIYSALKKATNSKHLWLRNNVSTICAQFIDTLCVTIIMASFKIVPWDKVYILMLSSMSFKVIAALLDTPFCYLGCYLIKKYAFHKHKYD